MRSTDLHLSSHDRERLDHALRVLLSPLDHRTTDDWRVAVNRAMKALLGADMATFILPVGDGAPVFSEEIPPAVLSDYLPLLEPLATRFSYWERLARLPVADRDRVWHPHLKEYYRSAYYNEYIVPNRAYDSLNAACALHDRPGVRHPMAVLIFHHERPDGPRFGKRGLALLQLLYPAFQAGVETLCRTMAHRQDLLRTLDHLPEGLLVYDLSGRLLHQNPAAARLFDEEPERERLRREITRTVRSLGGLAAGPAALLEEMERQAVRGECRTTTASYRLRGSYAGEQLFGVAHALLVSLERSERAVPSEEELRERFDLTRQEARVARLLAERKRNREIADALFVSPHTARHHTERVLLKLGARSRDEVASRLRAQ